MRFTIVVVTLALVYWFPLRRWFGRWGTTPDERTGRMPGDANLANPTHSATHAITIDARAEDVWPWLVQMGYQRGGLYSYDWLDRLFRILDRPSANQVLPEFQRLAVGDRILLGPLSRACVRVDLAVRFVPRERGPDAIGVARDRALREHPRHVVVHARHGTGGVHHDEADVDRSEATR